MPCIQVAGYKCFAGTYCLHLQDRRWIFIRIQNAITQRNIPLPTSGQKMDVPPKCGYPPTWCHNLHANRMYLLCYQIKYITLDKDIHGDQNKIKYYNYVSGYLK
jgi:hypothetical protein